MKTKLSVYLGKGTQLTDQQLKSVLGGGVLAGPCKQENETECTINPNGTASDKCCQGLKCILNDTGSGTICKPL